MERKLDFANSSIRRWDDRKPSIDKLQKVADYFDVSTDYLLGRTEDKKYPNKKAPKNVTVEEALASVMADDGKTLTENDRKILKGIIEGYLNTKDQ